MITQAELDNIVEDQDTALFAALRRYNSAYNNDLYSAATDGQTDIRCDILLDAAMALCGSPYSRVTRQPWTESELTFLNLFVRETPEDPVRRLLGAMTSLVTRANALQHAGQPVPAELWSDLYQVQAEAAALLAK